MYYVLCALTKNSKRQFSQFLWKCLLMGWPPKICQNRLILSLKNSSNPWFSWFWIEKSAKISRKTSIEWSVMRGMYPNCSLSKFYVCTMCSQKKITKRKFSQYVWKCLPMGWPPRIYQKSIDFGSPKLLKSMILKVLDRKIRKKF